MGTCDEDIKSCEYPLTLEVISTPGFSRCRKRERSVRFWQSAANPCSAVLRAYPAAFVRMAYGWITANASTSDEGRPVTVSQPDSPYAHTFRAIAARVWEQVSGKTPACWAGPRSMVA